MVQLVGILSIMAWYESDYVPNISANTINYYHLVGYDQKSLDHEYSYYLHDSFPKTRENIIDKYMHVNQYQQFQIIQILVSRNELHQYSQMLSPDTDLTAKNNSLLRIAIVNNSIADLKYLIDNGVDITAEDNFAIRTDSYVNSKDTDLTAYLIELGADIYTNDSCPLLHAIINRSYGMVKYLIEAGLDAGNSNSAPVKAAISSMRHNTLNDYIPIIRLLFDNGADASCLNRYHLEKIVRMFNRELIQLFIDYGTQFGKIDDRDNDELLEEVADMLVTEGVGLGTILNLVKTKKIDR